MRLALHLALRDLRGGIRGMRVVLACLAIGVAAIAAVGTLRAAIATGLADQGRTLLGGDIAIESGAEPLPAALTDFLHAQGARTSQVVQMRTLLVAPSGDRMLVDLKAVDPAYPLTGQATLDPPGRLQAALAGGAVADPLVLQRLNLRSGDIVRIGQARLPLRAALVQEPDHTGGSTIFGPRVMIALAALPATGLIQPGSLLTHELRAVLPPGRSPAAEIAAIRAHFPGTGWRIRDPREAAAGLETAIDQTAQFLTLVGLSALLVGGIGVATGVRAWAEGRARTIATLRCLGASARTVFAVFGTQILILCAAGIGIGLAAGAALVAASLAAFGDQLPIPAENGLYPGALALAALYGGLTAAAFALWPLMRAAEIPGAALFRDALLPQGRPAPALWAATAGAGALLVAAILAGADDRRFALGFCAAALATLALFRLGATGLMRIARRVPARRPVWAAIGIGNLHRPAAPTPLMMLALGLGLSALAAVSLTEGNLEAQFAGALPKAAPSFFFIDIQNDQQPIFDRIVAATPGATDLHTVPSLRARIVALDGVPVERARVDPAARWALRGDRGLTYSATLPAGSHLAAGTWWPARYDGPPLLSLDQGLARGWHLGIGSTLTANVLGRDITFRVASLRRIDWRTLGINFTLVASPGLLEHAPQMHIATLRVPPREDAALLRRVTDALPNVTGIRVADVLAAIADLVGKLAAALAGTGAITLLSGALVLAGAVAAGQQRRVAEAVVLKTLGATSAQIRGAWLVEFAAVGLSAGLLACGIGTLASWAVMRFVMHTPWLFLPGRLALTLLGCVGVMLAYGYASTVAPLRARPAGLLRNA